MRTRFVNILLLMMFGVECLVIYIYHLMTCKIHHTLFMVCERNQLTHPLTIIPYNIRYTSRVKNGMTNYTDGILVIQVDYVNVQQKICSNAVQN